MQRAPWNTIGLALFSWAAYADGEHWPSGVLAGIVICTLLDMLVEASKEFPYR